MMNAGEIEIKLHQSATEWIIIIFVYLTLWFSGIAVAL